MYVGQEGFVVTIHAQGDLVKKFDNVKCFSSGDREGCFVHISGLTTRATDRGVLNFTKESHIETVLYPKPPPVFPYYTEGQASDDMATGAHMRTVEVNTTVAMPVYATSVEQKERERKRYLNFLSSRSSVSVPRVGVVN